MSNLLKRAAAALNGEQPRTATLAISTIRRDGDTQPRQGMNEDAVTDYVAALADGAEFPPVDVMFDGNAYWLFDGFHRIEAHLRSERIIVTANIYNGTLEDARWRSYAANQTHGLRRSTADKERAIRHALRHPKAPGLSDRELARHLGVSDKTVGKYRGEMEVTAEIPQSVTRTGADGRTINVANIGKPSDDELRDKCHRIEFWLMGKGWTGHGYKDDDGNLVSGIGKGEHKFSWIDDELRDRYEKVKAAEKIERAAIEVAKSDTVSHLLNHAEAIHILWMAVNENVPESSSPRDRLAWFVGLEPKANKFVKYLSPGECLDTGVLTEAYDYVLNELRALARPAELPVPTSFKADPTDPNSMDVHIKTFAHVLPPRPSSIAEQFMESVEMAREMDADIQRILQTPQPEPQPTWAEGEPYERTGARKPSREFMIDLTIKVFKSALDSLDEYGQLTGRFTDIPPAQRILEKLIANLKENLT